MGKWIAALPLACSLTCVALGAPRPAQRATGGVELDVIVDDDHGRPVQGLRQDQFRVKEDGHFVPIESFTEKSSLGALGVSDGRSIVLVLDDTGIPPQLTTTVQKIARQFVDRMGQEDRLSVVRLTQRSDEAVGDKSIALSRIASYRGGMVPRFGRETLENALTRVITISRQLEATEHRRKVIVCIGAPDVFDINEPVQGRQSLIWTYWVDALQAASRANVGVYVIDPAGVTNDLKIRGSASLTAQTGGASCVNSNAFDTAVEKIWDEASHYYMLGYGTALGGSELSDIEVRVTAPGVRVRARKARG